MRWLPALIPSDSQTLSEDQPSMSRRTNTLRWRDGSDATNCFISWRNSSEMSISSGATCQRAGGLTHEPEWSNGTWSSLPDCDLKKLLMAEKRDSRQNLLLALLVRILNAQLLKDPFPLNPSIPSIIAAHVS